MSKKPTPAKDKIENLPKEADPILERIRSGEVSVNAGYREFDVGELSKPGKDLWLRMFDEIGVLMEFNK